MTNPSSRLSAQERARALLNGDPDSAGRVRPPEIVSRDRMRQLIKDPEWIDGVMDQIAEGAKLKELARQAGVKYNVFYHFLKTHAADKLAAARDAYADEQIHRNLELADDMQAGLVDASAGKAAAGIRQWYAERASNETWGQKSTTNLNVKGVIGLHLEALKQFKDEPLEGEFVEVEEEAPQVESKRHPLL
jgi:hypothetical protein